MNDTQTDNDMVLLPCPLCKGTDVFRMGKEKALTKCRDCGCSAPTIFWNTRVAINAVIPPGYKLVPIEPNPKMVGAALTHAQKTDKTEGAKASAWDIITGYRAMLAAAPEPQEGE